MLIGYYKAEYMLFLDIPDDGFIIFIVPYPKKKKGKTNMYLTHFVQDNTKILYWIAQHKSINDQHFTSQHEYIMM